MLEYMIASFVDKLRSENYELKLIEKTLKTTLGARVILGTQPLQITDNYLEPKQKKQTRSKRRRNCHLPKYLAVGLSLLNQLGLLISPTV